MATCAEAALLIAYIENVGRRPVVREDHRGFTIAVDADYGVGKSYFLKRLAKDLSVKHPVAFVDAWSDDLADEPLTAIAATLKTALAEFINTSPNLKERWDDVAKKTGEVAKIVALGALKKGLGLLITGAAVDAAEGVIGAMSPPDGEALKETLKDAGKEAAEGAVDEIAKRSGQALMEERISTFRDGQNAILALRASLVDLVDALPVSGRDAPIVIIIDELDRCRPTYAVKLLEETKHLFDTPGIVFILGMNSDQLMHSIAGEYGPGFEGGAYLRRFINREYKLSHPNTEPLIRHLLNEYRIDAGAMTFPHMTLNGERRGDADPAELISRYMNDAKFTARDAFQMVEIIQTCVALSQTRLMMPLLVPMILNKIRGNLTLFEIEVINRNWGYLFFKDPFGNNPIHMKPEQLFKDIAQMISWNRQGMTSAVNSGNVLAEYASDFLNPGPNKIGSFQNYERLLESVGRFSEV